MVSLENIDWLGICDSSQIDSEPDIATVVESDIAIIEQTRALAFDPKVQAAILAIVGACK